MALRAAVFDFDGVIVDSEPLHYRSLRDALRPEGVEISRGGVPAGSTSPTTTGRPSASPSSTTASAPTPRAGSGSRPARSSIFARLIPEIPVFDGARELVRALAAEMPLAIASGARHDEVEAILRGVGLRDAFQAIVGAEDAERTKPDPAPYLEAARRLAARTPGLAPAECVAFEDSMPGIASALGAGMKVVGVAHSYPAEKLRAAHRVVDSLVGLDAGSLRGLFAS